MEYILNSYDHKVSDNCLRFNFKKPIRLMIKKYHLWKSNIIIILKISQINLISE